MGEMLSARGRAGADPKPRRAGRSIFEALAPLAADDVRSHFAQLRGALALHPEFRERFLSDPGRAALVRNTAVVTTLRAGESVNMVPASAHATIDARLLPGESCIAFTEQVPSQA